MQWAAEQRLAVALEQTKADSAFVIVLDIKTGQLLALANGPGFDPNQLTKADEENRGNRAISAPYEPGSVQKVLTAAALIDSGTATPETKVAVPVKLQSGDRPIKDAFTHEAPILKLNMRGVIARSSNIGTVLLARQMDKHKLRDYLFSFGLGRKTGIELPGESGGIMPTADFADRTRDQIAFGQALAVTGMQEAAALAGILNGGVYNAPTVIKGVTDAEGRSVPVDHPAPRRVVSAETSAQVRDLMVAVVDSENGQKGLKLNAYRSGGKTGTAQRADTTCKCYRGYVTSYAAFAPVDDPQILTYVVVSNPSAGNTGTGTAAPVVRDLMSVVLPRYSVPPDATPNDPKPTEWE